MCLRVALDVVEHQPFAQREIAEREVVRAEAPQDRVEQHRAGDREVGAARIEAGHLQPLLEIERRRAACAAGGSPWRARAGSAASVGRRRPRLSASAPRLRIVPDVPMTRSKPRARDLVEVRAQLVG